MTFLSILKKIGSVAMGVEKVAVPIAETLFPAAAPMITAVDNIFQHLQGSIITVEANNPVDGQGQMKAAAVTSDFAAGLQTTNSILALEGKTLNYDDAALQAAISAQVAAYNAFATLKASFKIVALPASPAA